MPERIQLRRTKGWRLRNVSPNAVVVSRPSKWGNPYRGPDAAERFAADLRGCVADPYGATYPLEIRIIAERIDDLRGHDLACWCQLSDPCHADVLLEIANGGDL